jgi:hypothetical protein
VTEIKKTTSEAPVPAAAVPAVQHAEPQRGGSYTRNLATGVLEKAPSDPATATAQE